MKNPLKHLAVVGFVMFALLFGSTSYVQYFAAQSLKDNPLNNRTLLDELSRDRGPILVDGTPIAYSEPVDDPYKFQRRYGAEGMSAEMYASLTGYFSITSGTSGLERTENGLLSGTDDALFYDKVSNLLTGQQPAGAAVELTINPKAQKAAWDGLSGQRGAAVALDPKTGKVLAMVSTPGWDPNSLATHNRDAALDAYNSLIDNDANPAYNRAIGGNLYPPGSTFKLVTAAAALESGQYSKDSELPSPTVLDLPQTSATIRNAGGASCGNGSTASLDHALTKSCNTTFAQLGMDLGADAMNEQAKKFGFGESFDMPLAVTASSFPADVNEPQLAQSSLGQFEVRATPIQMAMVASAIANDGELMQPQLISQIRNARTLDLIEEPRPRTFSNPISSDTAGQLTDMMVNVVDSGTGTAAKIPGVDVAAKTGTAQHAKGRAPHAWFTSFAPADDPQVAVAVVVESGGNAGNEASGGRVAGPIAKSVMEAVMDS
ncbi:penicillin-binding protein 2 [Brevibacterium luteolum]|uniref:peptidoglycan D,D-transpeptidase FtsI family protein n=1 Tax=Brevibacterium luteolum TaxID=199591 RepID=UPI001C2378F7|nr:penicillin-binding protein 2 [Brevibacterium luteolum]